MQTLLEDVRYGLRNLRKNPGFTAVALLTLALGIGANTAVFSIVNGVLLNSLPFHDPDKLVVLFESKPHFKEGSISYPNFLDWRRENHAFTSIAAYRPDTFSLTGTGEAEQVRAEMLSADFFSVLGVKLLLGRTFTPEEDQLGAGHVALVSSGFWKRKLGSSPDVLGRRIVLDGEGYTIIGVVPSNFHLTLPNFRDDQDVFVPIGQWTYPYFRDRSYALGMKAVGRLKPGITLAQARADMDSVAQNLAAAFPQADAGEGAALEPMKQEMVGTIEPFLLMLLAAVCFVLLIACVNVANLLLARSTSRTREFAIRAALGASRARVIRQLLTESILLAMGGAALGLLLATWGSRAALAVLPVALPSRGGSRTRPACSDLHRSGFNSRRRFLWPRPGVKNLAHKLAGNSQRGWPRHEWHSPPRAKCFCRNRNGHGARPPDWRGFDDPQLDAAVERRSRIRSAQRFDLQRRPSIFGERRKCRRSSIDLSSTPRQPRLCARRSRGFLVGRFDSLHGRRRTVVLD